VSAAKEHNLLLSDRGEVFVIGGGSNVPLGDDSTKDSRYPKAILMPNNAVVCEISAGGWTSFAREATPTEALQSQPNILKLEAAVRAAIERDRDNVTLLRFRAFLHEEKRRLLESKNKGRLFSWGVGKFEQLGNGFKSDCLVPRAVVGLEGVIVHGVACGLHHVVIRTSSGTCYTWGLGADGQLGHGHNNNLRFPKLIDCLCTDELFVSDVSAGGFHTVIAVKGSASQYAKSFHRCFSFGRGNEGQLGNGNMGENASRNRPSEIPFFSSKASVQIKKIESGEFHSLVLCQKEQSIRIVTHVYAWGAGDMGQLGVDTYTGKSTPVKADIPIWEEVVSISAGRYHSLALTSQGILYTWGQGCYGALGNGLKQMRLAPANVKCNFSFVDVSGGDRHTVAIGVPHPQDLHSNRPGTARLAQTVGKRIRNNIKQNLCVQVAGENKDILYSFMKLVGQSFNTTSGTKYCPGFAERKELSDLCDALIENDFFMGPVNESMSTGHVSISYPSSLPNLLLCMLI
jgi:alpha-tubulin suppressor-like RCC1 family protein